MENFKPATLYCNNYSYKRFEHKARTFTIYKWGSWRINWRQNCNIMSLSQRVWEKPTNSVNTNKTTFIMVAIIFLFYAFTKKGSKK